jgi:pentapeptide repeat protein
MANDEDVARLRQGVDVWNAWRAQNLEAWVNLSEANLSGADLWKADLSGAYLDRADLRLADLSEADLRGANLSEANLNNAYLDGADLSWTDLSWARLVEANLSGADLYGAGLHEAYLRGANLNGADLRSVNLTGTDLTDADLTRCRIYGISAWDLKLEGAKQRDLVITAPGQPEITVDYLEVAQFIYLLLHNEKIRDVIDTITSKVVLILGRFTPPERKAVLDALRNTLREHDRTPVVFDFNVPNTKNVTDTVKLLAQLARYVIVDLSDPNSAPYELGVISMLGLDSTPVVPLIVGGQRPFPMLVDVLQKRWSTELIMYQDRDDLITNLGEKLLKPAEAKLRELRGLMSGSGAPAPFP